MMRRKPTAGRPIRVAHVALQLNTGGMERMLVDFARYADRQRLELQFISLGDRGTVADELEACHCPVTALQEPPGFRPGLVLRLARLFWREGVDIVHTHNTKPLLFAAPAARLAGVSRVIHSRHGQRFQASRRSTVLFRLASYLTDRVVCVSHDSANLSAGEGVAPKRIATIWNGIDLSRFAFAGPQPAGPVVMVGRLSPEKDVATLIRAVALVVREHPAFRLEIAGNGVCLADLKRLCTELGLENHVHFLGEVRDVAALLARASLFVLPSLTEGVSLTLLEAMARGLPVIATRVGGNPEVVVQETTGLLVPSGSPAELAAAMLRLLRCPNEGQQMGAAGRQRVEQCFDVRRMIGEYESLYLAGRGDREPGRASEARAVVKAPEWGLAPQRSV